MHLSESCLLPPHYCLEAHPTHMLRPFPASDLISRPEEGGVAAYHGSRGQVHMKALTTPNLANLEAPSQLFQASISLARGDSSLVWKSQHSASLDTAFI
jgi:hypothetical protein